MKAIAKMICPRCGSEMNIHGEKIIFDDGKDAGGIGGEETLFEFHACPACGAASSCPA
jgi:ribosomal protein S27AE